MKLDKYRVGMADKHGNTTRLHTDTSSIPSKHSKGGQSAQRWERYRSEKKKNYVRETTDTAQAEKFSEEIYFKSGEPMNKVRNISEVVALLRFRI